MKKIVLLISICAVALLLQGCLKYGLEQPENSSDKDMTSVDYSYRFLYDDVIMEGTSREVEDKNRVCDVVFNKNVEIIDDGVNKVFKTTLTYNLNSIIKSGPSGKVTKQDLFNMFESKIAQDGLSHLWVSVSISDGAVVEPLDSSPVLGKPGDYSSDRKYRVIAADGSSQDYIIQTIKGF